MNIEIRLVLDRPSGIVELTVNRNPGTLFGGETILVGHSSFPPPAMASHYRRAPFDYGEFDILPLIERGLGSPTNVSAA